MDAWTQGDVDNGGVRIHFHRTGNGDQPPLVLAHGFSDNALCWSRVAGALQDDFDLVMVDARNHGASSAGTATVENQAADIAMVISELGLERPTVMGHSVGANTMAALAAAHPEMVSRMILEDPPWETRQPESAETDEQRRDGVRSYIRSLADLTDPEIADLGRRQHPSWSEHELPDWVAAKRQLRESAADGLERLDWTELVPRIECPTLLIHGDPERGGIVTAEVAKQVETLNDRVAICSVDDAGHNIRRESYERFIDAVRGFLGLSES